MVIKQINVLKELKIKIGCEETLTAIKKTLSCRVTEKKYINCIRKGNNVNISHTTLNWNCPSFVTENCFKKNNEYGY